MNSPSYEEMKKNHEEMNKEVCGAYRNYFYVRNRNVPLTPEAMDALECSIQKHMAKFKVEFESNDEKIHITLPKFEDRIACVGHLRNARELQTALDVTKISTFFLIDKARCYESHIQDMKRILLQTQNRHQKCGGLEADIKNQKEILSIFEVALSEMLESPQG
ncbi:hypothetical protein FMUND_15390 [Fusarium mundagurra]|uniref:Uncharacterized protein n=1 Tax=Fusarium mundagurra TaxID=1567541 RepID=A0A8H5XPJ1_9HYPO|nr:hypothetical protein FMUND_15390 [Fusarium mundagurra]